MNLQLLMQMLEAFCKISGACIIKNQQMTGYAYNNTNASAREVTSDVVIQAKDGNRIGLRVTNDGGIDLIGMDLATYRQQYNTLAQQIPAFINAYRAAGIAKQQNPAVTTRIHITPTNDVAVIVEGVMR